MATVETEPQVTHSPPGPNAKRPRGILKNSFQKSPPVSPTKEQDGAGKEITIANTQANAGPRRRSSSAASRPAGSRRQSSRTSSTAGDAELDGSQRLKWDEANLYLTEQERTSTMKITEPKTPYAKHYDPSEDSDEDLAVGEGSQREEIPDLSLGEAEEEIPDNDIVRKHSKVHVSDEDATTAHDAENEFLGMTPEEREKHRKFEQLRKKHYEMKDVAKFLGHPETLDEMADEEEETIPPMPTINGAKVGAGD